MTPKDSRTDQQLIAAANRGDESAFVALYEWYRDWVVRLAERFTRNPDDAQDVLQETFKYLLGKFPGFELTAAMTTFLYPVVKNISLAILRSRHKAIVDDEMLANLPTSERDDPSLTDLSAVLAGLSVGHREVVLMRFVDGLSLEEIGLALAIPVGTVKSRLHHALNQLKADPRTRDYFGVD